MADNTVQTGSDTIRTIDKTASTGAKVQAFVLDVGGGDGTAESLASFSNPVPVQPAAAYFVSSTGNSTVAQLAVGATFTGTIDNVLSQPQIVLLLETDQPGTLTINQFITATDPFPAIAQNFQVLAGSAANGGGFGQSITLNGNYAQVLFTNTGNATTTKLNINTYYGTLTPTVQQIGTLNQVTGQVDPLESGDNSSDYDLPASGNPTGLLGAEVYNRMFDGAYWHRLRGSLQFGQTVYDQPLVEIMQNILIELRVQSSIMHATLGARDDLETLRASETAQFPTSN